MPLDAARPTDLAALERLAVEFADAAYPLTRRLGFGGSWLDLELGLRNALADAVGPARCPPPTPSRTAGKPARFPSPILSERDAVMPRTPTSVVLIHGLWMTPRSWDRFRGRYEARGERVVAPPWPRFRGDVDDVRRDPSALAGLGLREIVDRYDEIIRAMRTPPVLIGHSFGGLVVQMLLDRGLGAAGVAISSAAPKGVLRLPLSTLRAVGPILANPWNRRRTVALSFDRFRSAFAGTMSERDARAAYDRDAVPGPARPLFQGATANLNPFAATTVDFRNPDRAPLLLIAGGEDRLVPPAVNRENVRRYARSPAVTEYKEFSGRSHLIVAQDGWEEVADFALDWAKSQAAARRQPFAVFDAGQAEPGVLAAD